MVGKDSDAGRHWEQEEKWTTEDEMAGWHHWLNGHESEWTLRVGDGQGGLACCDSWGHRLGHDWATELNWAEHLPFTQTCSPPVFPFSVNGTIIPSGNGWAPNFEVSFDSSHFSTTHRLLVLFSNNIPNPATILTSAMPIPESSDCFL